MRWLILARTNALKRTHKFTREALKYMGLCAMRFPLRNSSAFGTDIVAGIISVKRMTLRDDHGSVREAHATP
jgi:hypothetical protein